MIDETNLKALRLALGGEIESSRYQHTLGVEKEIRELACFFLPERETEAAAAALLHDLTRAWSTEEHLAFCIEHDISVTEEERKIPALLHAKTAVGLIPLRYPQFASEDVLTAIRKHTVADAQMSVFESLLFIADFTEEGRHYASCQAVRNMLHEEMAKATKDKNALLRRVLLAICDASLEALQRLERPVASATVEFREALLGNHRYFS